MTYRHDHIENTIRRHLAGTGVSVRGLARKAGIAPGTIQSFLSHRTSSLRIDTAYRLAEAMDMELWELLGEKPPATHELRRIIARLRTTLQAEDNRLARYLEHTAESQDQPTPAETDPDLPYVGHRPNGGD